MTDGPYDSGSFRDRHARVFYVDDGIYRGLSPQSHAAWRQLSASRLFAHYTDNGGLVRTEEIPRESVPGGTAWTAVLRHERIPFVSYPYEWPFQMLKAAALLQLDLLLAGLDEGLMLKDCTPYNVQWRGAQPVFIDIASFDVLRQGEPWPGYRQYCELFLYPLMLQAYKDVPFQAWLRGSLEGISSEAFDRLMSTRDHARRGVLLHVHLQARMQTAMADSARNMRQDLRRAGFNVELIKANARRLRSLVAGLSWRRSRSEWSEYERTQSYDEADRAAKAEFVRTALAARPRRLVWDLGANIGSYSRLAADQQAYVVAIDRDHLASDRLYGALARENDRRILPLVMDLADPSPGLGWRHAERKVLEDRGAPDMALALALVHHMVITANVPLQEWITWLCGIAPEVVVEFVAKDDPMTERLLRNKEDQYGEYDRASFERLLSERMTINDSLVLQGGRRVLYHATRRREG